MKINEWSDKTLDIALEQSEELLNAIPSCEFSNSLEMFIGELWDEINTRQDKKLPNKGDYKQARGILPD